MPTSIRRSFMMSQGIGAEKRDGARPGQVGDLFCADGLVLLYLSRKLTFKSQGKASVRVESSATIKVKPK